MARVYLVMHIYLDGLCAAGVVNRFNDIFTSFTHINGTMSQMTSPVRH